MIKIILETAFMLINVLIALGLSKQNELILASVFMSLAILNVKRIGKYYGEH